jgi:hypothetical protein
MPFCLSTYTASERRALRPPPHIDLRRVHRRCELHCLLCFGARPAWEARHLGPWGGRCRHRCSSGGQATRRALLPTHAAPWSAAPPGGDAVCRFALVLPRTAVGAVNFSRPNTRWRNANPISPTTTNISRQPHNAGHLGGVRISETGWKGRVTEAEAGGRGRHRSLSFPAASRVTEAGAGAGG